MGKTAQSLAGQKFGKLTALEPTDGRKNGYVVWRCRCDCGGEALVPSRFLKNGWTQDCGCVPKARRYQDLTGRRFGKLTVLEEAGPAGRDGRVYWRCRCDCGAEVVTTSGQLTAGYKKSCGCLGHPPLKDWIGRRFGTLEVLGHTGKCYGTHFWHCKCHCGCGRELDVSQSALQSGHTRGCKSRDWNLLPDIVGKRFGDLVVIGYAEKRNGAHLWRCRCVCGREVVVSQSNLQSGHTKSCGCRTDPRQIFHFVEGTRIESIRNRKLIASNTSGVRGVYQNRKNGQWVAQITFQRKTTYLGSFRRLEDAAKARLRAEEVFDAFLTDYDSRRGAQARLAAAE